MIRTIAILVTSLAGASLAWSQGQVVEDYSVNAQFRGTIKKSFPDIGTGHASFERLGDDRFRVSASGSVRHPEEDRSFDFSLAREFALKGDRITVVAEGETRLNDSTRPHLEQMESLMPFTYLARLPPESGDTRSFQYRGDRIDMRFRRTDRHVEVEVHRNDGLVAKFFMLPAPDGGLSRIEKFRIPLPDEDIVLSFVQEHQQARR